MEDVTRKEKPLWYQSLKGKAIISLIFIFIISIIIVLKMESPKNILFSVLLVILIAFLLISIFYGVVTAQEKLSESKTLFNQRYRKEVIEKVVELLFAHRIFFFLYSAVVFAILLLTVDLILGFNLEDLKGVIVEAHGLLLDIVVLGIIFTIYESVKNRNEEIENCKSEIEIYKNWKSEEATIKIIINIEKLNKEGCTYITFNDFFFKNVNIQNLDLRTSSFHNCSFENFIFKKVNLSHCSFIGCNFKNITFYDCVMERTNLGGYVIMGENYFQDTHFIECYMENAIIKDIHWFGEQIKEFTKKDFSHFPVITPNTKLNSLLNHKLEFLRK